MKTGIYTANTTAQAVGANSALPLGSIIRRFGCAVDLNGTGVNISDQGYYAVDGSITYTPTDAGLLTVQLMADGVAVPGASASVTAAAATTYNLSIVGMVRRCCSAPGTLTLMVNLAGTVNNVGLIVGKVA